MRRVPAGAGALVDPSRLDRNLAAIVAAVDQPVRHWPRAAARALGVSDRLARLVVIIPGVRDPWLGAVAVVLALATLAGAVGGSARDTYLFLVVAPLLPVPPWPWCSRPATIPLAS